MIKISRISSPLKDKIKNVDTCSQLDGDGLFEGKYTTTGTVLIRNGFVTLQSGCPISAAATSSISAITR